MCHLGRYGESAAVSTHAPTLFGLSGKKVSLAKYYVPEGMEVAEALASQFVGSPRPAYTPIPSA
jgi:hypothetical protein